MVRAIFDQAATEEVCAQHGRVVAGLDCKYPDAATYLDEARSPAGPPQIWK
jgi:hypothetical protein